MKTVDRIGQFVLAMALALVGVIAWSAWKPAEWGVWWMEMSWVLGVFAVVAAALGVLAIMAMAAGWEIIEWIVAVWDGGSDGLAFLGSQGDVWDAQKDMLCDTLGAITAAMLFVFTQKKSG